MIPATTRARMIFLTLATLWCAVPALADAGPAEAGPAQTDPAQTDPGQTYVVTQTGGGPSARLVAQLERLGAEVTPLPQIGVVLARSGDAKFEAAATRLPGVLEVAPDATFLLDAEGLDGVASSAAVSLAADDDELRILQWAHDALRVGEAWDLLDAQGAGRGAGVRVAILDNGLDADHPDLAPNVNVALGRSFIAGEPWQARSGVFFHHGTAVAGIVAAADNGLGVVGVAPEAELVAVKVISDRTNRGSAAALLQGIVYAADVDADVINMSLGSGLALRDGEPAARLWTAFTRAAVYAHRRGATLVAAAGNDARDLDADRDARVIPAQLPHALAVAATTPTGWALDAATDLDRVAAYSNFGRSVIDLAAPGGDVRPFPGDFDTCTVGPVTSLCVLFDFVYSTISGGWSWAVGTSAAAPHVAGVAALVIGQAGGNLPPAQVAARLRRGADDLGAPGHDPNYGHGRISALGAVQ